MTRKTLTEWPKTGEPVPEGLHLYRSAMTNVPPLPGRFVLEGGRIVFALLDGNGGTFSASVMEEGETFEPVDEVGAAGQVDTNGLRVEYATKHRTGDAEVIALCDEMDASRARLSALEAENAMLKARIATLLDSVWDPWPTSPERAALEAENAGLRARVVELEASIEQEAAYRREQQERQDRLAGVP